MDISIQLTYSGLNKISAIFEAKFQLYCVNDVIIIIIKKFCHFKAKCQLNYVNNIHHILKNWKVSEGLMWCSLDIILWYETVQAIEAHHSWKARQCLFKKKKNQYHCCWCLGNTRNQGFCGIMSSLSGVFAIAQTRRLEHKVLRNSFVHVPGDAILCHKTGSTWVLVMAWHMMAPSH